MTLARPQQSICHGLHRHGARTPLTKAVPYWDGACWLDGGQDCGSLFEPVSVSLRDADNAPARCSQHNIDQVLLSRSLHLKRIAASCYMVCW